MAGNLRARLDAACYDGEGIDVTKEDVISLLDALHLIRRQRHCDVPGCTNLICCQAAIAVAALRNAGEEI